MGLLPEPYRDRTRVWVAWAVVVVDSAFVVTALSMAVAASFWLTASFSVLLGALVTAVIGALVVTHRPRNRTGWLMIGGATSAVIAMGCRQIAYFVGVHGDASTEATQALIAIGDTFFGYVWLCWLLMFLTFPDGRLPSPRWRPIAALLFVVVGLMTILVPLGSRQIFDVQAFLENQGRFPDDTGVNTGSADVVAITAVSLLMVVVLVATAASLVERLRRAEGEERQQIKWSVYVGVLVIITFPVDMLPAPSSATLRVVQSLIGGLPVVLLGIGFGIALFKYRLWNIDLVIRRSLVYGVLWLAIVGAYAGAAVALGVAAGSRFPVELAIVLAVVATLLFQPARRWLERAADRWVFGRRESPIEAMHDFGELVGSAQQPGDIATHLARTAADAIGLASAEVELDGSATATVGTPTDGEYPMVIPIAHNGERVGQLMCRHHPGRRISAADRALLDALAAQAGLAVSHARLASRIVQSQDIERRRIERNIHDGAQQELVALVAQVGVARAQANGDGSTERVLGDIQQEIQQILSSLRSLAQGIHPSVLTDGGLVAAVEDRCSRLPVKLSLDVAPVVRARRFSDDVEGAAYFFISEAVTNVLKHSDSTVVDIWLDSDDRTLTAAVVDHGIGFDPTTAQGSGIRGLVDRIHAIGGRIVIDSRPGAGASLTATLPIAPAEAGGS